MYLLHNKFNGCCDGGREWFLSFFCVSDQPFIRLEVPAHARRRLSPHVLSTPSLNFRLSSAQYREAINAIDIQETHVRNLELYFL